MQFTAVKPVWEQELWKLLIKGPDSEETIQQCNAILQQAKNEDYKFKINASGATSGKNAVYLAIENGNVNLARWTIAQGGTLKYGKDGRSPFERSKLPYAKKMAFCAELEAEKKYDPSDYHDELHPLGKRGLEVNRENYLETYQNNRSNLVLLPKSVHDAIHAYCRDFTQPDKVNEVKAFLIKEAESHNLYRYENASLPVLPYNSRPFNSSSKFERDAPQVIPVLTTDSHRSLLLQSDISTFKKYVTVNFINRNNTQHFLGEPILNELVLGFGFGHDVEEKLKFLFRSGFNPNVHVHKAVIEGYYNTPLHTLYANELSGLALRYIQCADAAGVGHLINLSEQDGEKKTVLHMLALLQDVRSMEYLLNRFGSAAVNIPDENEKTPLHYACACRNLDLMLILIKHGADINIADNNGHTSREMLTCSEQDTRAILEKFHINPDRHEERYGENTLIDHIFQQEELCLEKMAELCHTHRP